MVRKIYENELKDLLELYLHLHESTISEMSEYLSKTWNCVFSTAGHAIDSEQRGQGLEIALPISSGRQCSGLERMYSCYRRDNRKRFHHWCGSVVNGLFPRNVM